MQQPDTTIAEQPLAQETDIIDDLIETPAPTEVKKEIFIDPDARKQHKALQEHSINMAEQLNNGDTVVLPSNYDRETRKALEKIPNVNLLDSKQVREWASDVTEGLDLNTYGEAFVPTLEDESAEFRHKFEHGGVNMMGATPRLKVAENQNLKGERAIIRLIGHLGLGTLYQAPMWHSGLWVTFKPPTETEIVELNRVLMANKISLGRATYGLAFSNVTAYTVDTLMEFAIRHVYDISAKAEDITIDNLRDHLSCQDIPSFLWGFICTMYPKGYRYRRACIADPHKCNHVVEETLNVTKLQWVNTATLTDWQKTFMSGRQSKTKELSSIARYKEELKRIQKSKVVIAKDNGVGISITLKTPSVSEYVEAGHRWIGDIVETVERALASDASMKERNDVIIRYGQASAMHQYSHWVESIEYETNMVDDKETIENTLDILSSDDEIRVRFTDAVTDYINKSMMSVVGIPVFDCPACGVTHEGHATLPQYKNIIPLDMVQLFFALHTQRVSRMTTR